MPKSPEAPTQELIESGFEAGAQAFIHSWAPHTALTIGAVSIGFFLLVMLLAAMVRGPRNLSSFDLLRAGFAAGPIPVYFLLPLSAYDADLSAVILSQPFILFLAGVIGIRWTINDILDLVKPKRSGLN